MIEVQLLKDVVRQVRLDIILLAALVYFGNIAIRAWRLRAILNKDRQLIGFRDAYLLTLMGVALNIVVPATLGDLARAYYGYKIYGLKEEILSTALVDKLFALSSLFLLGAGSGYVMHYAALASVSLLCALLTLLPLTFPQCIPWKSVNRLLRLVKKSLDIEKLLTAGTLPARLNVLLMLISLAGWFSTCFFFYVVCRAFPVTVSFGYVILIMPLLTLVRLFPFTFNALGPMEVAVVHLFGQLGIAPTVAVLISLTSNVLASLVPGCLGFILIFMLGHGDKGHADLRLPKS